MYKSYLQYLTQLIFIFLLFSQFATAQSMKGPTILYPKEQTSKKETEYKNLAPLGMIRFFSNVISPIDGPRSPSYPTGSAYGFQAINEYGFVLGSILTADRLLHESDIFYGPYIYLYGQKRYYDPLYYNTYWWK